MTIGALLGGVVAGYRDRDNERCATALTEIIGLAQDGEDIREAATALAERLLEIHRDPAYIAVWRVNQLHAGPYTGPKYDDELAALCKALGIVGDFDETSDGNG